MPSDEAPPEDPGLQGLVGAQRQEPTGTISAFVILAQVAEEHVYGDGALAYGTLDTRVPLPVVCASATSPAPAPIQRAAGPSSPRGDRTALVLK